MDGRNRDATMQCPKNSSRYFGLYVLYDRSWAMFSDTVSFIDAQSIDIEISFGNIAMKIRS